MKKILRSILVCAVMIITFGWNTNCVKAEDNIEIYNGVKYRVNNEQKWASVCGYSGDAEDLEIPFMVGRGIIVSQIDDHAFDGCSSVKILTIPDTIVKVGDMSFIGMDNLQAVISTARGINIVVRDNVKIVKDRNQLDNSDNNNGGSSDNNNNSSNNTSSDSGQGNSGVNNTPDGTGNNGNGSIGTGGAIINSDENVIIDSSNGTVIEENIDKNVADGSTVVGSNDNSKSDNKVTKSEDNVKNKTTKSAKRSQAPKIIAYIVCIIAIIAIAAGAFILIKKRRR